MTETLTSETRLAPRLPNDTQRTVVIGSTGSGKSVFGVWLLSTCQTLDWKNTPVVIFDWKGDGLLNSIGAKKWGLHQKPPTRPGLYIVHPDVDNLAPVDLFLNRCWEQENIGLFFDEAAELEKSRAVNRIMKQGRSKHIPCISCTQRPVWLPRCVFSEAEYFALLRLNDADDKNTVKRFINADVFKRRDEHAALWYDVTRDRAVEFLPVPPPRQIADVFNRGNSDLRKRKVV